MKIYGIKETNAVDDAHYSAFYADQEKAKKAASILMEERLNYGVRGTIDVESIEMPFIPKYVCHIMLGTYGTDGRKFESVGVYANIEEAESSACWTSVRRAVRDNPDLYKKINLDNESKHNRGYEFWFQSENKTKPASISYNDNNAYLIVAKLNRVQVIR